VGEFGDKFRKAREKKELSLDDVSAVTKISPRMLQAIEEQHFDQLPGGVFNRGFIRAYAKHLGLDSEEAVNDYLACLRQEQIDSHNGWDANQHRDPHQTGPTKPSAPRTFKPVAEPQPPVQVEELPDLQLPRVDDIRPPKKEYLRKSSAGIPWLRIAIAITVLLAVALLWTRHTRSTRAAQATPSANSAPVPQPSSNLAAATLTQSAQVSPPPAPAPVTPVSTTPATSRTAVSTAATDASTRAAAPVAAASTSTKPTAATADGNGSEVQVQKKGDVTIRSFAATPAKSVDQSATKFTLVIRATENSWISIISDGQPLTQETLIAPAATTFHATHELVVRVGNAAGVSFSWNGHDLPPQGAEAEAKTFIFDSDGMHPVSSTPPTSQP